jgi:hypothetical protein
MPPAHRAGGMSSPVDRQPGWISGGGPTGSPAPTLPRHRTRADIRPVTES